VTAHFDWDPDLLIGNKTIGEMLKTEIDISSRKINLKLLSEFILMLESTDEL
jgi:hypothetical protein